jgi:hypothetical protein
MGMQTKSVYVASSHDCCKCRKRIEVGSRALRGERRAETYRERCYAGARGEVVWYWHETCAPERSELPRCKACKRTHDPFADC